LHKKSLSFLDMWPEHHSVCYGTSQTRPRPREQLPPVDGFDDVTKINNF